MQNPLVSVIVPAFNGADLIGEAVRSVLDQTYDHLELIVVDDGSIDGTADVVRGVKDARLKYLSHPSSQGACAARATGLGESRGDIIAFLDQDDLFHRDKLGVHVSFLQRHPEVGFTYNPFFILSHPSGEIVGTFRPPAAIKLEDLILGYPIPPSAWVVRRQWAMRGELWDPSTFHRGREIIFCGRLFVAGCRFSLVNRVLHSRRIEVGRRFTDPVLKCQEERLCQEIMLGDPRCPPEVQSQRDTAYANTDLVWAYLALVQGDTATGNELLRRAIELAPSLVDEDGRKLVEFLLAHAVIDAEDPEQRLRSVFSQFPPELGAVSRRADAVVGEAHLIKAAQHATWGRLGSAGPHLARASTLGVGVSRGFLERLCFDLLTYEAEFGTRAVSEAMDRLGTLLEGHGNRHAARRLRGTYHLSQAFDCYGNGNHHQVPGNVLRAFAGDPRTLRNRGAWSILLRSALALGSAGGALSTAREASGPG